MKLLEISEANEVYLP